MVDIIIDKQNMILLAVIVSIIVFVFLWWLADDSKTKNAYSENFKLDPSLVIRQCLVTHKNQTLSFEALQSLIGGYKNDELRQLLIGAGAVRFVCERGRNRGQEEWGLLSKNQSRLNKPIKIYKEPEAELKVEPEPAPAPSLEKSQASLSSTPNNDSHTQIAQTKTIPHEETSDTNLHDISVTQRAHALNVRLSNLSGNLAAQNDTAKKTADLNYMIGRVENG